ncbi:Aldo/keto reductase [Trametes coccinea BRFM310]|uniref:Aldo/keto reductase n=1 Tax=Trametes coccinea (strain BRFM310) TaxID=1353009 RepID=A0A1Y2IPJ3_TRAC3|nr:Aldo/keto reductase [Trametes coccinea BRFM310]
MASQLSINSTVRLSSGYELPLLGLGVYQNDDCKPAVLAALKHGYRHIDTARMYGNEAQVGEAVRESGVPRDQVFVTSKIANDEHGYDLALGAVDASLKTLGFDYVDYFLIHSAMSDKTKRLETWRALLEAKKQGKVKAVGVSNYGVKHLEEIREAGLELPSINQIEVQPLCQQKEIVDYCKKHNIVVEAYAPLMRGQWDIPAITETAKKYNKTPAQILVRWSLQRGFAPLPKSASPERVISNAEVFDFEIGAEDMARIDALDKGKEGAITWNPVDVD